MIYQSKFARRRYPLRYRITLAAGAFLMALSAGAGIALTFGVVVL